jgi:hypothetical protein
MKVSSDTGAMADLFDAHRERLEDFTAAFRVVDCQTGALFAIGGQVLGLECFGCQDPFNRFFDKLVQSYALDAIDRSSQDTPASVPPDKARRFLASSAKSKAEHHPTIGLGKALRFESRIVSGAALVEKRNLLHLSAFRKVRIGADRPSRYERFSRRRNYRIR